VEYAILPVPRQDNWKGYGRKGIRHKNGGNEFASSWVISVGASVSLNRSEQPRNMAEFQRLLEELGVLQAKVCRSVWQPSSYVPSMLPALSWSSLTA